MTNKRKLLLPAVFLYGALMASLAAAAQTEKLQLDHLNRLSGRATEAIEVDMDQRALRALGKLAALTERDRSKLAEMATRLQGVYVRGYEFEREGEFSADDIEIIRSQLRAPGWGRIAQVGGRDGSMDEVYLKPGSQELEGFTVISTSPRKICVINVVGQMKFDDLGLFDSDMGIARCGKWKDRRKSEK